MKKKFKTRKRKRYLWFLFLCLFIYMIGMVGIKELRRMKLTTTNEEFLRNLMYNSNHYLNYEKSDGFLTRIVNSILQVDFSSPISLVTKDFIYDDEEVDFVVNTNNLYLQDPDKTPIVSPKVYIYNSHQAEEYSKENYEEYGITPGVMMASYLLKEKLNKLAIPTIAEEGNMIDFMRVNNYTHGYSYVASRYFIEPVIRENNFDLIIDLHRDSNTKSGSTVLIDGKSYAKVLFVVGLENKDYEKNLRLAETLNKLIVKKYPTLSRGIYKKEGPGVDGVYNQDLSPKIILLEVGGYQNTVSEVNNTLEIMADIIKEYMESL